MNRSASFLICFRLLLLSACISWLCRYARLSPLINSTSLLRFDVLAANLSGYDTGFVYAHRVYDGRRLYR